MFTFFSLVVIIYIADFINVVSADNRYYDRFGERYYGGDGWGYDYGGHTIRAKQVAAKLVMSTSTTPAPTTAVFAENRYDVDESSPCDPYEPKKPNYAIPFRRLSVVKCYEYIWEVKEREIKRQRAEDCGLENIRKLGGEAILIGRLTKEGEFPHMAAVGWRTNSGSLIFKCGGSLISENFVLTAGHCTKAVEDTNLADLEPKMVRLGRNNIGELITTTQNAKDVNILEIISHPLYAPPKKYYDIALLKLEENVVFNHDVYPACLWTNLNLQGAGTNGTVTGWGVEKLGDQRTSPELKAAEVNLIDSLTCDELLEPHCNRHWCGIESHQMCAGTLGGADTCQGDSGGPIQVKINLPSNINYHMHSILGVTSFGIRCGLPDVPGIYTRVASFAGWIENIVWK